VALFIWYWDRTRGVRTIGQWALLGLLAGLMGNVYYPNAILLTFPAIEIIHALLGNRSESKSIATNAKNLTLGCATFLITFGVSLLPTFITRKIIYGNPFETGYPSVLHWNWASPAFLKVLFSSDHGVFSWTPILLLATIGLLFLMKRDAMFGQGALLSFLAYYYFIASYPDWDGLSSYGNRFFVSLTPIFVLGLAALLDAFSRLLGRTARAAHLASSVVALLTLWNLGFIFQWGTHMVPARGEISWSAMVRNQFVNVPLRITHSMETYFLHRNEMMQHIEQEDIQQQQLEDRRGH